jgi:hypothetical protein
LLKVTVVGRICRRPGRIQIFLVKAQSDTLHVSPRTEREAKKDFSLRSKWQTEFLAFLREIFRNLVAALLPQGFADAKTLSPRLKNPDCRLLKKISRRDRVRVDSDSNLY